MAVVSDPGYWSQNWSGTDGDDLLVYNQGHETIDGKGGYDILQMPFPKSHYVYSYQSGVLSMDESSLGNPWSIDQITGVNIEQVQFADESVTLVPRQSAPSSGSSGSATPGRTYSIGWSSGGRWMKYSKTRKSDTWWIKSGKGKSAKYLVDNDVTQLSGINATSDTLKLLQGSWSDVYYRGAWGGTMLFNGNNIIAFLDGFDSGSFGELNLI